MNCLNLTNLIRIFLIIANYNIIFLIINMQPVFQEMMQMLDVFFGNWLLNRIKDIIKAPKMVGGFRYIPEKVKYNSGAFRGMNCRF